MNFFTDLLSRVGSSRKRKNNESVAETPAAQEKLISEDPGQSSSKKPRRTGLFALFEAETETGSKAPEETHHMGLAQTKEQNAVTLAEATEPSLAAEPPAEMLLRDIFATGSPQGTGGQKTTRRRQQYAGLPRVTRRYSRPLHSGNLLHKDQRSSSTTQPSQAPHIVRNFLGTSPASGYRGSAPSTSSFRKELVGTRFVQETPVVKKQPYGGPLVASPNSSMFATPLVLNWRQSAEEFRESRAGPLFLGLSQYLAMMNEHTDTLKHKKAEAERARRHVEEVEAKGESIINSVNEALSTSSWAMAQHQGRLKELELAELQAKALSHRVLDAAPEPRLPKYASPAGPRDQPSQRDLAAQPRQRAAQAVGSNQMGTEEDVIDLASEGEERGQTDASVSPSLLDEEEEDEEGEEDEDEEEKELNAPLPATDNERQKYRHAVGPGGNPTEVLVKHGRSNIEVTRHDMACMAPGTWLNDEIINLYMALLQERDTRYRNEARKMPKCHFFSSFFLNKLIFDQKGYNYASVRRWTMAKKLALSGQLSTCILQVDRLIMPVHLGMHWTCAMVDIANRRVVYLDSLGGHREDVTQGLLKYVRDEAKDKLKEDWDTDNWRVEYPRGTPQQENGYDCGVFTMKFAEYLGAARPFDFSQENMKDFRIKVVCDILRLYVE